MFTALSKYKTTGSLTPEENFFTETFAFLLKENPQLQKKFVEYLGNKNNIKFEPPYSIITQQYSKDNTCIPDLIIQEINNKKRSIFIEIKINSRENEYEDETGNREGQVKRYLRQKEDPYVCFIAHNHQKINIKNNRYLGQFDWTEIYKLIKKWQHNNRSELSDKDNFLISQFLYFMEDKNMKPFDGFSTSELDMFKTDKADFMPVFLKLFGFFEELKKDKRFKEFSSKHNFKWNGPTYNQGWYGIWLCSIIQNSSIEHSIRLAFEYNEKEWFFVLWIYDSKKYWNEMRAKYPKLPLLPDLFNEQEIYQEEHLIDKQIPLLKLLKPGEDGFKDAVSQIMDLLEELGKEDGVLSILKKEKDSA